MEDKKVKRIISQKVVDQIVFNGVGGASSVTVTQWDEVVEYEDGTTETIRTVTHDTLEPPTAAGE